MKLVLDTEPLASFFNNEKEADKVEGLLKSIDENRAEGFISAITLSELFCLFARAMDEGFSKNILSHIKDSNVSVVAVTEEIAETAGEFKFRYACKGRKDLPLADAIIAATAFIKNAELVSSDPHFDKIKEIKLRKL